MSLIRPIVVLSLALCRLCVSVQRPKLSSYVDHPCNRDCISSTGPRVCEYNFTVEHYQTLSRACYNCPRNISDCFRPHCVSADGGVRAIKVVNRMMPGPQINVCKGDMLQVTVYNEQHDMEGTSIHWHGILQSGTPFMDGVPMVTQCPIHPHSSFQYRFLAANSGTHYWHAHAGMQRADGIFGALVVRETASNAVQTLYDHDLPEHTVLVHDWLDQYTSSKFSLHHHGMADNQPSSILINGRGSAFGHSSSPIHDMDMGGEMGGTTKANMQMAVSTQMPEPTHAHMQLNTEMGGTMNNTNPTMNSSADNESIPTILTTPSHSMVTSHEDVTAELAYTPRSVFRVTAGLRYRFRFISNGILNCPLHVSVEHHNITIIATDGHDVTPTHVQSFTIFGGERYDIVLTANQPEGNYWLYVVGLGDCVPKKTFETAVIRYNGAMDMLPPSQPTYDAGLMTSKVANPVHITENAITLTDMTSADQVDPRIRSANVKRFYVNMDFNPVENYRYFDPDLYSLETFAESHAGNQGAHLFALQLNRITYRMPMSPLLTQYHDIPKESFCNETSLGQHCSMEFCECTHRIQVAIGDVVELVLISEAVYGAGNHPMHLHGYAFYVIGMEQLKQSITRAEVEHHDAMGGLRRNLTRPVRKDTVMVPDGGYTIIRFVADNPGFWLFHCHIDFHLTLGMTLVLQVGDPQQAASPPADFPRCGSWAFNTATGQGHTSGSSAMHDGVFARNKCLFVIGVVLKILKMA